MAQVTNQSLQLDIPSRCDKACATPTLSEPDRLSLVQFFGDEALSYEREFLYLRNSVGPERFCDMMITWRHDQLLTRKDLPRIAKFAERFGPNAPAALNSYSAIFAALPGISFSAIGNRFDSFLERLIATNCDPTYMPNDLTLAGPDSAALFVEYPEEVCRIVERWGSGGYAILARRGKEALHISAKHAQFFDEFIKLIEKDCYFTIDCLHDCFDKDPECWSESTETFLAIATILGEDSLLFIQQITARMLKENPQRLVSIAILTGRLGTELLECFGDHILDYDTDAFRDLVLLYRAFLNSDLGYLGLVPDHFRIQSMRPLIVCAAPLLRGLLLDLGESIGVAVLTGCGLAASMFRTAQIDEIKAVAKAVADDDGDDEVFDVVSAMHPTLLSDLPGFYLRLAEMLGQETAPVFSVLLTRYQFAMRDPEYITAVVKRIGPYADDFIKSFGREKVEDAKKELAKTLMNMLGSYVTPLIEQLDEAFAVEHGAHLIEHATLYGKSLPALIVRFGIKNYFASEQQHRAAIIEIQRRCPNGAPDIFRDVPEESWNDIRLLNAIDLYREATGPEMSTRGDNFCKYETPELTELRLNNRNTFGLHHFYRLCPLDPQKGPDVRILRRNLMNLELAKADPRPICVHAMPRADRTMAFFQKLDPTESLKESYLIFYIEFGSGTELNQLLRKIACLRGVDVAGNPLRPIEHFIPSSHSCPIGMYAGFVSKEERDHQKTNQFAIGESYIAHRDFAVIQEWGTLLASDATVALDGCSVIRGGELRTNFGTNVKRTLPGATVWGSRTSSEGIKGYILNKEGRVVAVKYDGRSIGLSEPIESEDEAHSDLAE